MQLHNCIQRDHKLSTRDCLHNIPNWSKIAVIDFVTFITTRCSTIEKT